MASQPPVSPWMGPMYNTPSWDTPRQHDGGRDRAWLAASAAGWNASERPRQEASWKPKPDAAIRMVNHWDNLDGSIERGYAGRSIFFEGDHFRGDWDLIEDYAALLESVRINALCMNNVNVRAGARELIVRDDHLAGIERTSQILGRHGVSTFIAVNFAAPRSIGGLDGYDPLDPAVVEFWRGRIDELYTRIPDFGGFVVKADAEGEPGPHFYGRTHAEGANMLARLLEPHGGKLFWRAFVYNHQQDWRDRRTDRAKAAYEQFLPLDGEFDENVVLQVKNGPIDFQVREPVSPLFGAMEKTNMACEFQITQEYLGQQQHVCYLAPIWSEVLGFRPGGTTGQGAPSGPATVAETLSSGPRRESQGVVGVANIGLDSNWTGHKLAQANLYAFGRLAWDSSLVPEDIAGEWTQLTFPDASDRTREVIQQILCTSRDVYRDYTTPLGLGFMCRPGCHYGVDVDGYEYDRWGTYHFADRDGVGVDRTAATGSGYTQQYPPETAAIYEDPETCPDDDLLFFHHVPYGHVLHSGKTVIQHIYDSHFAGAAAAERFLEQWETCAGDVAPVDYENVHSRLEEQVREARQWRDVVNTYFLRHSGVPDEKPADQRRVIYP